MRTLKSYISICIKGICMGAADVVPGVSGGTIAFLTGIYTELLNSIKSINLKNFKLLFKGELKEFWKSINGWFLISLFLGIIISFLSLSKVITYLMSEHPVFISSFFFGLIVVSAFLILKDVKQWRVREVIMLILGVAVGATICLISPTETPNSLWFIFLCGVVAITAMILPGISGSFILLLLGKYVFMLEAINQLNIPIIAIFISGAIIGIVSFSHLLTWLLNRFHNATICMLSGFMVGSLVKVWPWKAGQEYSNIPQAIIFFVIGAALVLTIEIVAKRKKR